VGYSSTDESTRFIGDAAKNQASSNPEGTVFDVKRLIGRQYSDSSVQKDKKLFPFGVVADGKGKPLIEVKSGPKRVVKKISPEEVSGMVSIFLFSFSTFLFLLFLLFFPFPNELGTSRGIPHSSPFVIDVATGQQTRTESIHQVNPMRHKRSPKVQQKVHRFWLVVAGSSCNERRALRKIKMALHSHT